MPVVSTLEKLARNDSLKTIAVVGGVVGAIGLGAYTIYVLSGQAELTNLNNQLKTILNDYLDEVDRYVRSDGPNGLTQSHKDALAAKVPIIDNIINQEKSLAAQGLTTLETIGILGAVTLAAILFARYGLGPTANFIKNVRNSGTPKTGRGMYAALESSVAVQLTSEGNLTLAQGWFNNGVVADDLSFNADLLLEEQQINAVIQQLQGLQLAEAQLQLASIANDLVLISVIEALARSLVFG